MHEIGHALGLSHINNQEAAMYSTLLNKKTRKLELQCVDKLAMTTLYGKNFYALFL